MQDKNRYATNTFETIPITSDALALLIEPRRGLFEQICFGIFIRHIDVSLNLDATVGIFQDTSVGNTRLSDTWRSAKGLS